MDDEIPKGYKLSALTAERLQQGQSFVMCFVSDVSEADAIQNAEVAIITDMDVKLNSSDGSGWEYGVPIDSYGRVLNDH